jgi:uncharacterized protein (UPF0335 family)
MTTDELKKKCKERAKIFQQAMESCHSSSPMDCIEWFADRITELEKENAELKEQVNEWLNAYSDTSLVKVLRDCIYKNEKLSSQEQQQLSAWVECAMDFGSNLDECADQLTKAKEEIRSLYSIIQYRINYENNIEIADEMWRAEQFLKDSEGEK